MLGLIRDRYASDPGGEAFGHVGLSMVALAEGDADAAAASLDNALLLASTVGVRELIFSCLLGSAEVATLRGEGTRAARLVGAAHALREEMGYIPSPREQRQQARIAAILDGGDAATATAETEGRALTVDEVVAYALGERG